MTKYIPFEEIQIIFHTKKAEMEAIIASLPSSPYLLKPPLLLSIMTGEKWNSPNIISHHVLRIYIAAIFYIESIRKDPMSNHFLMVKETLKAEQKDIFAQYAEDESKFLLQYIHAYERALIKYIAIAASPGPQVTFPNTCTKICLQVVFFVFAGVGYKGRASFRVIIFVYYYRI